MTNLWLRFPVCSDPAGLQVFIDFCLPEGNDAGALSEAEMYRLYCHVLLQQIPAEGLKETAESLDEMRDFYAAAPVNQNAIAPESKTVEARLGQVFVRPVFPITDEE